MKKNNKQQLAQKCIEQMLSKDTCSKSLGIDLVKVTPGFAQMSMIVTNNMLNGHNVCHGGMIFSLADTTFACACNTYNLITVALGVDIEFMRPCFLNDNLIATAKEKKRGKTTGIYDIEVSNQDKKLVALFRGKAFITENTILKNKEN